MIGELKINLRAKRDEIDRMLKKRSVDWSEEEVECYGNKIFLREYEMRLIEKEVKLMEKDNLNTVNRNLLLNGESDINLNPRGEAPPLIETATLICIPQIFTAHFGIGIKTDLILYKRHNVSAELKFLKERVVEGSKVGMILGPSGVGKSVTAFAFACKMAATGWRCTWIHFKSGLLTYAVQFADSEWSSGIVRNVSAFIKSFESTSANHIVFLDGYKSDDVIAHETFKQ